MERGRAHTPRRQPPVANSLLPERRHLSVVFRPSVNLPDFMTRASRELMDSCDFFCLWAGGGMWGWGAGVSADGGPIEGACGRRAGCARRRTTVCRPCMEYVWPFPGEPWACWERAAGSPPPRRRQASKSALPTGRRRRHSFPLSLLRLLSYRLLGGGGGSHGWLCLIVSFSALYGCGRDCERAGRRRRRGGGPAVERSAVFVFVACCPRAQPTGGPRTGASTLPLGGRMGGLGRWWCARGPHPLLPPPRRRNAR